MSQTDSTPSAALVTSDIRVRAKQGFVWGLGATLAMTIIMFLGTVSGMSPIPRPVPPAVAETVFGAALPSMLIAPLGMLFHFLYGGIWAALFAVWSKPLTIAKGAGLGLFLWLLMQVTVLPLLGWGVFGSAVTVQIAVATLVLHLVYGLVLGALGDRSAGETT
jgi:hypothetical protein